LAKVFAALSTGIKKVAPLGSRRRAFGAEAIKKAEEACFFGLLKRITQVLIRS
jgi:hypothetical protein